MPSKPNTFKPNWIGESKPVKHYQGREERSPHYSTKRWQRVRALHLADNPLCVRCHEVGKLTPANVLDHIIPHRIDDTIDFFDSSNHQGLCTRCHNQKNAEDKKLYNYSSKESKPTVILVYGPPGSGKTTWALKQDYNLLIDMDLIWQEVTGLGWYDRPKHLLPKVYAERDRRIDSISKYKEGDKVIVISTNLKAHKIKELTRVYKPSMKRFYTTEEECIERIEQDDRREGKQQHIELVKKWFNEGG